MHRIDDPVIRLFSDFIAAPRARAGEKKKQQRMVMMTMHIDPLRSFGASNSISKFGGRPCSFFEPERAFSSRCSLKQGFDSRLGGLSGRQFVGGSTGLRQSVKEETFGWGESSILFRVQAAGKKGDGDISVGKAEDGGAMQVMDRIVLGQQGNKGDGVVEVQIENLGNNSRKIVAKIAIEAPLDDVWAILTDYEHLADFIPGLAVSQLLEKRHNGARLYQVGEQNLALGMKFKAKAVVDCEEKPTKVHQNFTRRDIDFETVEGDFQVFRGTWRMEQLVSRISSAASHPVGGGEGRGREAIATILSYILIVQPKIWLPVALVEGKLTTEVKTNLVSIRDRSLQPSVH